MSVIPFKAGLKVILNKPGSKHHGKEGTIISEKFTINGKRWKVKLDDPGVTPYFIFYEENLEHTKEYSRNEKLNKLGI